MPRFSIIVPYFNNANTLRCCIDSVLNQTFSDWELILVDDGSVDGGIQFGEKDGIREYRQEHKGVSSARNRGIQESLGDYLLFLDADDYLDKNYLQAFAESLFSETPDICLSGLKRVECDGSLRSLVFPFSGFVPKEAVLPSFYEIQRTDHLYGYVAGKAVQREFLMKNNILFNEHLYQSEDLDFFLRCYEKCTSFLFIPNTGYHYVQYDSGTSMFRQDIDYFSMIELLRHLKSFCRGHMNNADEASYRKTITEWTNSAILDTRINNLQTLPETIRRISRDPELNSLGCVSGPTPLLAIKVLARQTRILLARYLRKLWQ